MMKPRSHRKKNNTLTKGKIEFRSVLEKGKHPEVYEILGGMYERYASNHIEVVVVKTFLCVFQQDFEEGEVVPLERGNMFMKVELVSF